MSKTVMSNVDPDVIAKAESLLADARVWVRNLDRSRLGTFANNSDALVVMHAVELSALNTPRNQVAHEIDIDNQAVSYLMDKDEAEQLSASNAVDYSKILGELHMWWTLSGVAQMKKFANNSTNYTGTSQMWLERYERVYRKPELAEYYAVELFEYDFVLRCHEAGVDAHMALTMDKERSNFSEDIIPRDIEGLADFAFAVREAWSAETSSYVPEYFEGKPKSAGQSAATALVVHDHFGGNIKRTIINGELHHWNEIDYLDVDLTRSQFEEPLMLGETVHCAREDLTKYETTMECYQALVKNLGDVHV